MPRTMVVAVVLLAVALGAGWADAGRSQAASGAPQLSAEPADVAPGETLVLSGRGFPRNAHIALLAGPPGSEAVRIGGAQTGRRGAFTARIRIRPRAAAGRLVALACVDQCRVKASARFRIVVP
jgi:hypothetical protein